MRKNVKIGIIGGDMRQAAIAADLSEKGFETAVWGLPVNSDIGGAVRCADWYGAVNRSDVVILPIPASRDGVRVTGCELFLGELFSALKNGAVALGGALSGAVVHIAKDNQTFLLDYFSSEEVQIENVIPTVEGALETAIRETDITLHGARVLVCGYGRIGKVLSRTLRQLGALVTVSARSREDIANITIDSNAAVMYSDRKFYDAATTSDIVFNTVPARIFDKKILEALKEKCLVIDLASGDDGIDYIAAKELGVNVIHALALPGKTAPVTAGKIICKSILNMLLKEGVI